MIQQLLLNGVIAGAIYALVGFGFALVYRTVRFFHFAHGIVCAAGAYVAFGLVMQVRMPVVSGWLLAIGAAAVLGLGVDRLVYLPLRKQKAPGLILLLASFGVFIFLQNLVQLIWGAQILTLRTGEVKEGHHVLGAVITDIQIVMIVVSCLTLAGLVLLERGTKLGKETRAVADDPLAASVVGIDSERTIAWVFFIGSALAGLAGILISYETNIEPTMGFNAILKGIIASIVGGIGSIPGAALGGLVLGLVENLGIWKLPAEWKDAIAFVVLILFLLVRPQGILGKKQDRV